MDDKHYKKLMRRFTVMWFLALAVIILLWIIDTRSARREMQRYVETQLTMQKQQPMDLPEPIPGKDGRDGIDGQDGTDGKDGVTTTIERRITEVVTVPGEKGDQGEQGLRGRELQIQLNTETGNLETKYEGDDFWQTVVPCVELLTRCKK